MVISGIHKRDQISKDNLKFLVISADPVVKTLKSNQKFKTFPILRKCFHLFINYFYVNKHII